ncbi:MAG: phospholipase [Petroclostridium sp.]|jgi:phospholipase C|nr:phospholipase [Petroclostridium sp.]
MCNIETTGEIRLHIPRIKPILQMVESITFPIAISVYPWSAEVDETISSGIVIILFYRAYYVKVLIKVGDVMSVVEKTYGNLVRFTLMIINPFKKTIIKTQCKVHIFINMQALEILKNDNFEDAYYFFSDYAVDLNKGVVWADQDLKSIGHFYSPLKERGLYGQRNALSLAEGYYEKAKKYWKQNDINKAMFYLGATVHLIQDMTIPQHANIRLLDNHHQYEKFVQKVYNEADIFKATEGGVYLRSVEEFIRYNAKIAIKVYKKFHCVPQDRERFFRITKYALPLAEKTTAGCFLMFYRDVSRR